MEYMNPNPIQEVYIGYYFRSNYNKKILGVSKKKSVIKNYLENHRGLTPNQYLIVREEMNDIDLLAKYSDYIISSFMGYYIPEIDQCIIEIYSEDVNILIDNTIENLKRIYLLSENVKKVPEVESRMLLNTIKVLLHLKSFRIIKKLKKQSTKSSPILFCNINEYLDYVRSYQDQREMNSRYTEIMMNRD